VLLLLLFFFFFLLRARRRFLLYKGAEREEAPTFLIPLALRAFFVFVLFFAVG
jgi:hypothetical protein